MLVKPGDTFLLECEDSDPHLYIVLTCAVGDPLSVLAVPITTNRVFRDQTVVLSKGDHPFINRDSSVHYSLFRFCCQRYEEGAQEKA